MARTKRQRKRKRASERAHRKFRRKQQAVGSRVPTLLSGKRLADLSSKKRSRRYRRGWFGRRR